MNIPLQKRLISICIQERVPAQDFDSTRKYSFDTSTTPLPAQEKSRTTGGIEVRWLTIEVDGIHFGWTYKAVENLIDRAVLRVFVNGIEQDNLEILRPKS